MEFADSSASEICATCSLPLLEYTIPIINEFVKKGPFKHQRLFMIMGHDQSYKTSIAVELLTPFLSFKNLECEAVWLDCDYKFPLELLKSRNLNLNKLKVAQCRCSEELIFTLLAIENEIEKKKTSGAPIRAIVIDSFNSFFWIDSASSKLSSRARYDLIKIVEQFVSYHSITMILVNDDLGFDSEIKFENAPVMKLFCVSKSPGKGELIYDSFSESFTVLEDRTFRWGNNHLIPQADESNEKDDDN